MRMTLLVAVVLTTGLTLAPAQTNTFGTLVKKDPRFDRLLPPGSALEKLADGYTWVEGPVWNRKEGYLLFSEIPSNSVMQWKPGGSATLFLKPSGYTGTAPFTGREPGSNGLAYDSKGRL